MLVTGGAGFLGAAFAQRARALGHHVVTLDRARAADLRVNVEDVEAVALAVRVARPEVIVHLAAMLTTDAAADALAATCVNALGTAAVYAAAARAQVPRVIDAGSIAAIGATTHDVGDDATLAPLTVYGATKAYGEHLARALSVLPGQPEFVVLRFGWIYGPGRVRGWRVVQEVVEQFARGEAVVRYPDFAEPIDFTYVDDAVEVLLRACAQRLPAFSALNVLGDRRTMRELVQHLTQRFPRARAEAIPAVSPPAGWRARNDGLGAALGYVPDTRLEEGVDALLDALASGASAGSTSPTHAPKPTLARPGASQ